VQRAGRIDRIGTEFDLLHLHNLFPERGLERLLKLVESLQARIAYIDDLGMLDASVLGEEVHPRAFNALKRIEAEDGSAMAEEGHSMELASNEYMLKLLVQVRELRQAYQAYQQSQELPPLVEACTRMRDLYGTEIESPTAGKTASLAKEHLRLVCFDMVSG
jgi:hypothetical protein